MLQLELEGVETLKGPRGMDCLALFLAPPSLELHEQRIMEWARPSEAAAAACGADGTTASATARASGMYDEVRSSSVRGTRRILWCEGGGMEGAAITLSPPVCARM